MDYRIGNLFGKKRFFNKHIVICNVADFGLFCMGGVFKWEFTVFNGYSKLGKLSYYNL